jgi:hypothetical protein
MSISDQENVVPLFKTFEELHRDEVAIYQEHYSEWHRAYARWDVTLAVLKNDNTALAKCAGNADFDIAKAEAQSLKKQHGDLAEFYANSALIKQLRALVDKRNERLFGLGEVARRSARFASVQRRPYYGPAAAVLSIGATKQ